MMRRWAPAALLLATAGCTAGDGSSAMQIACAAGAESWSRTELYFGLSRSNGPAIGDAEFHGFVDREITPRFPDGLTVLSASGQWRGADGTIVKEGTRMLVLLHQGTRDAGRKIDEIRNAYRAQFDQDSVLRVDDASCVSF